MFFFRGGFEVLKNQFAVRSAGLAWLGACNTSEPATALETTRPCVILCCFAHSRRSMLTNAFHASIVYRYSCLGPHPSSPAPPCGTPSQCPIHRSHVQVFSHFPESPALYLELQLGNSTCGSDITQGLGRFGVEPIGRECAGAIGPSAPWWWGEHRRGRALRLGAV